MRFPKMHIAQSVTNRIMNLANSVAPRIEVDRAAPAVPDPSQMGVAIDQALAQPPGQMAAPEGAEAAVIGAALDGTSSADELAQLGVIDDAT